MTNFKRIEKHYQLSDEEFEQQFQNCLLSPVLFTHEAHLRLAFIHILKYGESIAIKNITSQLKNYVIFAGEKGKYHETITVVSIKEIALRMNSSHQKDFRIFIQEFPELLNNFKSIINNRYSFDVFQSNEARRHYLKPDKLPYK